MSEIMPRNLGLDLVHATEDAALKAGRWMGLGIPDEADQAATQALIDALNNIDIVGTIVIGEEKPAQKCLLEFGSTVGTGKGPELDIVTDPVDGTMQLAMGHPGALSTIAVAPAGCMWAPRNANYMDKIVVDKQVASALVPECLDAPAAWTLALVARAKGKAISDLTVFALDRPRHIDLITDIRATGARVVLRPDGDIAGSLMAVVPESTIDILMGVGGVLEGLITACAVKALGGAMLGRLEPQTRAERDAIEQEGLDSTRILTCHELVASDDVIFAATGITSGPLLSGISYKGRRANSNSLILRGYTHTRRRMRAEHEVENLD